MLEKIDAMGDKAQNQLENIIRKLYPWHITRYFFNKRIFKELAIEIRGIKKPTKRTLQQKRNVCMGP